MDHIDLKILDCLQHDASLSASEIAEKVNLSKTPCWRRIQMMEKSGVISKRVALLNREKLNRDMDVFVTIRTNQHNAKWFRKFSVIVNSFPEVVEFYRMSGDVDYLMRVVVPDLRAYDRFYQNLIEKIDINDVSSNFAMEQIKYTTAIPLHQS
ncbi:MAG: Lrp/AsnC family transcriptional regulator [Gammaproteobacteria bacterium]|nr:Lrp/AsnC family transcriptional regulator [Gammaproteobacteria bacterium]